MALVEQGSHSSERIRISYAGLFLITLEEDGQTYYLGEMNDTSLQKDPPQYEITLPGGAYKLPSDPRARAAWDNIGFIPSQPDGEADDIRGYIHPSHRKKATALLEGQNGIDSYPVHELWEEVISRLPSDKHYTLADITRITSLGSHRYTAPARNNTGGETYYFLRMFDTQVEGDLAKTIVEAARSGDTGLCLVPVGAIQRMIRGGASRYERNTDNGLRTCSREEVAAANMKLPHPDDQTVDYHDSIQVRYHGKEIAARLAPTWSLAEPNRISIPPPAATQGDPSFSRKRAIVYALERVAPRETTVLYPDHLATDCTLPNGTPLRRRPPLYADSSRITPQDIRMFRELASQAVVDALERTIIRNRWNSFLNLAAGITMDGTTISISTIDNQLVRIPLIAFSFLGMTISDSLAQKLQDVAKGTTREKLVDVCDDISRRAEADRIKGLAELIGPIIQGWTDAEQYPPHRLSLLSRTAVNTSILLATDNPKLAAVYAIAMGGATIMVEKLIQSHPNITEKTVRRWIKRVKDWIGENAPYITLGTANNIPTLMANVAGGTVGTVSNMGAQRIARQLETTQESRDGKIARETLRTLHETITLSLSPHRRQEQGIRSLTVTDPGMRYEQTDSATGKRIRRYAVLDKVEQELGLSSADTHQARIATTPLLYFQNIHIAVPGRGERIVDNMTASFQGGKIYELTDYGNTGVHLLMKAMAGHVRYPKGVALARTPTGDVYLPTTPDITNYVHYVDADTTRENPIDFPDTIDQTAYLRFTGMFTEEEILQFVEKNIVGNNSLRTRLAIAAAGAVCYPEFSRPDSDIPLQTDHRVTFSPRREVSADPLLRPFQAAYRGAQEAIALHQLQQRKAGGIIAPYREEIPPYPIALLLYTNFLKSEDRRTGEVISDQQIARFLRRMVQEKNIILIVGQKTGNDRFWRAIKGSGDSDILGGQYMVQNHRLVPYPKQ